MTDPLSDIWRGFLTLLVFCLGLLVLLVTGVFIAAVITGYRHSRAKPVMVPAARADPYVTPMSIPQGARFGDHPEEPQGEFCPLCHYHWSICANVHVLHHETVPDSIQRNTARSLPS